MAKLIDFVGYREIMLMTDTELAIIAFRIRVAEMCKAEITTEDRDKESNGLVENAVMLIVESSEPSSVTLRAAHRNHSVTNHRFCSGWWDLKDTSCPNVKHVVTGKRKKPSQKFVPFGDKVVAKHISSSGFGLACKTTVHNVSLVKQMVYQSSINQKIGSGEQVGQRSQQERNRSILENDRRPVDPPLPFEGARIQSERITKTSKIS